MRPSSIGLVCLGALLGCMSPGSVDLGPPDQQAPDLGLVPAGPHVGYEIFVRSFADSNGDGAGDLDGITGRLTYLQDLGVDTLWLTPIHPSPSYHGYDVTDYEQVNPDFGTLASFDRLVGEARQRGMRVLLDMVFNHTSSQHPWFLAALNDPAQRGRYLFRDDDPGWQSMGRPAWKPRPAGAVPRYYFSIFSAALPDLNYRDPRTLPALTDVLGFWLRRGVAGFRFDAARYLVEWPDPVTATTIPAFADTADTHKAWQSLRAAIDQVNASAWTVGEVWTDLTTITRYRGAGDELHACFNFPLAGAILDGVKRGDPTPIRDALAAMAQAGVPVSFFSPFLSNHDQPRAASQWGQDPALLRLGAALLLGMPGVPFVYYGEEIGMTQTMDAGDRAQRGPMQWTEVTAEQADAGSLLQYYRRLLRARRAVPALWEQEQRLQVLQPSDGRLLALSRGQAVLLVYNLSGATVSGAHLTLPAGYPAGPQLDLLSSDAVPEAAGGGASYGLPDLAPHGARWLTAK